MELILLGIKEQHQEYIVCKDGRVGSWAIGHLFLRSFTPLQSSNGPTTLPISAGERQRSDRRISQVPREPFRTFALLLDPGLTIALGT
jgi:hypothetical protein